MGRKRQLQTKRQAHQINLDIVGFSRGEASARMFASKVQEIMNNGNWYAYRQEYHLAGFITDRNGSIAMVSMDKK